MEEKSAMLADNLACLMDVIGAAGFTEDQQQLVASRYANWLLSLRGAWNVVSEQPNPDMAAFADARDNVARFLANALVSLAKPA
jgi:hypothetical protein